MMKYGIRGHFLLSHYDDISNRRSLCFFFFRLQSPIFNAIFIVKTYIKWDKRNRPFVPNRVTQSQRGSMSRAFLSNTVTWHTRLLYSALKR